MPPHLEVFRHPGTINQEPCSDALISRMQLVQQSIAGIDVNSIIENGYLDRIINRLGSEFSLDDFSLKASGNIAIYLCSNDEVTYVGNYNLIDLSGNEISIDYKKILVDGVLTVQLGITMNISQEEEAELPDSLGFTKPNGSTLQAFIGVDGCTLDFEYNKPVSIFELAYEAQRQMDVLCRANDFESYSDEEKISNIKGILKPLNMMFVGGKFKLPWVDLPLHVMTDRFFLNDGSQVKTADAKEYAVKGNCSSVTTPGLLALQSRSPVHSIGSHDVDISFEINNPATLTDKSLGTIRWITTDSIPYIPTATGRIYVPLSSITGINSEQS